MVWQACERVDVVQGYGKKSEFPAVKLELDVLTHGFCETELLEVNLDLQFNRRDNAQKNLVIRINDRIARGGSQRIRLLEYQDERL